jgi:NADH dehydrogenase
MILVVGATGNLGGIITRMLLAQGRNVRILARPQSNYQPLVEAGALSMFGDLKDRDSLDPLCQGIETLITTANSGFRGGDDNPETVDLWGNHHLIDAAKAAGVKQFIFMSSIAADPNSPVPIMRAKGITEDYLRASDIPYTIIDSNAFMEMSIKMVVGMPAMADRRVTIIGEGSRKHSFISINDVAAFNIAAIGHPAAINQKLYIGGPEPLSFLDAVAVYERVLGHEIPVSHTGSGELVEGIPEIVIQVLEAFNYFDSPMDTTELAATLGIHLTSLEEIARKTTLTAGAA